MSRVLVIGCGGVASVAIQKCCQADTVFTELCIASRTKEKCDALALKLEGKTKTVITTARVDADDVNQLIQLINNYKPSGNEYCTSVPGSDHYGCMPGMWRKLYGYGKL